MEKLRSNTCILALKNENGKIVFAADRRESWGMGRSQVGPSPKITKRKGILFATSGVGFVSDMISLLSHIPEFYPGIEPFDYVHTYLFPEWIRTLREKGVLDKDYIRLTDSGLDASVLIGIRGHLFEVILDEVSVRIEHIALPYSAGCGGDYAIGAYLALESNKEMKLTDKIKSAMKIAAHLSPGCDSNIDILIED